MKLSLIIATYNSPVALKTCFEGLLRQTVYPYEVLVADDGSTDATAAVVEEFSRRAPFPVKHVWHPDEGFRLGAIRNKAIAAATGDYIVQIDGDILLEPHFIADHIEAANPGRFACGSRVLLDEELTQRLYADPSLKIGPFTRGVSNRKNAVRSRLLSAAMHALSPARLKYRGCNMAFWRSDLVAVNGYDEAYSGWGCEDHDLVARLMNAGILPMQLRHSAVCFHMWHPSSKESESFRRNNELLERTRAEKRVRCVNGLDRYTSTQTDAVSHDDKTLDSADESRN